MKLGIDYFSLETDIKDDDKIFNLKYRYGMSDDGDADFDHAAAWAAYGRFIDLLASIYHEGFAIEVTNQKELRLSQQLGMSVKELRAFIETCVEVGLFEESFWKSDKVLTSHGIQKRYFHAVKRRTREIPENMKRFVIGNENCMQKTENCEHAANMLHTECAQPVDSMSASDAHRIEEDRREEKSKVYKTTEEERKGASTTPSVENSVDNASPSPRPFDLGDLSSKLSSHFSKPIEDRPHMQPFPLSCFSVPTGKPFKDLMEQPHATAMEALCASYRQKTGSGDSSNFISSVAKKCPRACSESPEQVCECFEVMLKGLKKFNRTKCHSPTPLVLKVLDDRKTVCE